jgi:hypothetical protein
MPASRATCEYRQETMCDLSEGVAKAWSRQNPLPRAALQLRVPGTLRYSWVVMAPHIRPDQRRQPAEVLRAYERLTGFAKPVGSLIQMLAIR